MSGLSVDTEALGSLALRMARTRDEVAAAARLVEDCAAGGPTAAAVVAYALTEFDDQWRYGLKRIIGNLDACHAALHDAAAAYQQVEAAIAGSPGDQGHR